MSIRVLIVDDSALVRQVLTDVLDKKHGIEVMAAAQDPIFAMRYMEKEWPDVIVLDIEMPRMDGLTFLRKIMSERPTPVVICSTLTEKGTETAMQAMSAGAVDIITKPKVALKSFLNDANTPVIDAVRAAAQARIGKRAATAAPAPMPVKPRFTADAVAPRPQTGAFVSETTDYVVAIGTSTGGTKALEVILPQLRRDAPGIVVVQHMPEKFTAAFAQRLNSLCEVEVSEARQDDRVLHGHVLIAPGGMHMMLKRSGAQYRVDVKDGPLVSRHKPSVDVLFRSVAGSAVNNAVGIILTGMGDDGAAGMLEMHKAGALTIAEHASTCIVHGMPKEAVKRGGVDRELPLHEIPALIQSLRDRSAFDRVRHKLGVA